MSRFDKRRRLKFLFDENVDVRVGRALTGSGHSVTFCPKGISDTDVLAFAKKDNLIIITYDTDFTQLPPETTRSLPGIIVLRIHPPNHLITVHTLAIFIAEHTGSMQGICIVLNERGYVFV